MESVRPGTASASRPVAGFELIGRPDGWLRIASAESSDDAGFEDLRFALQSPVFPFHEVEAPDGASLALAPLGEEEPLFLLRERECLCHPRPGWHVAAALLLYHRVLRLRDDAIFFHAASLVIGSAGLMLVGPKGAGKSTTALALAARGHSLLGDETAAYVPKTGELIPVLRPVGIKPGPRAAALTAALARLGRDPDRDGTMRLDVRDLFTLPEPRAATLSGVIFLCGFRPEVRLEAIEPTREEMGLLQPIVGSLVNASPLQRTFEMIRLLGSCRVFKLWPAAPEATAQRLEEAFA